MGADAGALDPFDVLLADRPAPFALLHRPEAVGPDRVELLTGPVESLERLADIPVPDGDAVSDTLVLLPFRQLGERGHTCHDDGERVLAMSVRERTPLERDDVLARLPREAMTLSGARFEPDDESYADIVHRVLRDEIGEGSGSNFVIHRDLVGDVGGDPVRASLALFRTLLERERGAYWTFVVHTGDRTFVGASPERHVSLDHGTVVMNPISGTVRHPDSGPELDSVLRFLADRKEADELYMVVDEELKMMARLCPRDVRVVGPRLKEMGRVAHTEYLLEGTSERDVREVLRETMFAPTVTGSPVENAARVIARYEPTGRAYYSGAIGLIGRDAAGAPTLDSAILIRTADVSGRGELRMGVGATLVRESRADAEIAETRAKAGGLLAAVTLVDPRDDQVASGVTARSAPAAVPPAALGEQGGVRRALAQRNDTLSRYWLADGAAAGPADGAGPPALAGLRGLIVDAEDTFTTMLGHVLGAHGADAPIVPWWDVAPGDLDAADFVISGPGPGDPRDVVDPKIVALRRIVGHLLDGSVPFLSVCLSHQVLCDLLGLDLVPLPTPHQGTQREIDLFGRSRHVGFYNTFTAHSGADRITTGRGPAELAREAGTGHVHGLRATGFASVQFHPESVLTRDGHALVGDLVRGAVDAEPVRLDRVAA